MKPDDSSLAMASESFRQALRNHLAYRDDHQVEKEWIRLSVLEHAPRVPPMRIVLEQAQSAAKRDFNVIVQGPPGSPKIQIARIIHEAAKGQSDAPRVFSCAGGKPSTLTAAALAARKANTSLLLTYLDKADIQLQHTLLGLIESHGARCGPRCIGTTTRDLTDLLKTGDFDGDLRSQLCFDRRIIVPALKDHKWDIIPTIVSRIIHGPASANVRYITYAATLFLREYEWPGDLHQLCDMIEWLIAEANENGDTAIRLEPMIKWFRHYVPKRGFMGSSQDSLELGYDPDRLDYWWTRLGSEGMAWLFLNQFDTPYDDRDGLDGGWKKFERENGYCPDLFTSEVGEGTLVCDLELHPLYSDRTWLASKKRPKRRGWKKIVEVAGIGSKCKVTVESADSEILFDFKKIERELKTCLMKQWPIDGLVTAAKHKSGRPRPSSSSPTRRHPQRDWLIHDEVAFGFRKLGFGQLDAVCDIVSKRWESIGARRVRNLYYELQKESRPSKCEEKPPPFFIEKYPQFALPETG